MNVMVSRITGNSIVCSTACSGRHQWNTKSPHYCSMVRGIYRWYFILNLKMDVKITKAHNDLHSDMRICKYERMTEGLFQQSIEWAACESRQETYTLQWRHNERNGVTIHRLMDCLLNRLFRCKRSKKTSKLRVTGLWGGIHRWPVNSPHKGSVTRKMFSFDDVIMACAKYSCQTSFQSEEIWSHFHTRCASLASS